MAENVPQIYKAINMVMQDISAIGKNQQNKTQHFAYRSIDDVMNELHSSLTKAGIFIVPKVTSEEREEHKSKSDGTLFFTRQHIDFTFYAQDGSSVTASVIGEAMDSGDKASNKALSIGYKYACIQVFCIPTEDDKDPDNVSHVTAPAPAQQSKQAPAPQLKGGPSTPEEANKMKSLLKSKYHNGQNVFSEVEYKAYSNMRKTHTAQEVIKQIEDELNKRIGQAIEQE